MDLSFINSTSPKTSSLNTLGAADVKSQSLIDTQLVSSLGSISRIGNGLSSGLGTNLDLYDIIGKQSQGFLSQGITGSELAKISEQLNQTSASTDSNPTLSNPGLGGLLTSLS